LSKRGCCEAGLRPRWLLAECGAQQVLDLSPTMAPVWRPEPTPFDAEDAPAMVASVFGEEHVDRQHHYRRP
jgi:hypothetical protein